MKRIFWVMIVSFILCLSIPLNSFASGVGGALDVIQGSNIDPRTDSRYADKYNLDDTVTVHQKILEGSPAYGDVVMEFTVTNNDETYRLKSYARLWYDDGISEVGKPCIYLNENTTINGYGPYNIPNFYYGTSSMVDFYTAMINEYEQTNYTFSDYTENRNRSGSSSMFSYYSTPKDIEILSSDFPVFTNMDDVNYYRETGIIRNAKYDPTPKDYSSELYFKSFEVIPHASNSAEYYFFDIKYELSDYAKKNIETLNLNFESLYRWETSNTFDSLATYKQTGWYANSIPLSSHPYGFSIRISDLGCYRHAVDKWHMLPTTFVGNNVFFDISNSVIHTLLPSVDIIEITEAYLSFKFNLRFIGSNGVVLGKRNDFTYDILNKKLEKYIYTPNTTTDGNGNIAFVKDDNGNITYTQEGDKITSNDYYYNNVEDDGDTVVNNYFYYDKDGNKKQITKDEYDNNAFTVIGGNSSAEGGSASVGDINININNTNNNGSSEYININPVDFNQFVKGMEDMLKQFDTKGGLFLLIKDVFSMYPPEVTTIAVGAIAAIAIVSIICILRR